MSKLALLKNHMTLPTPQSSIDKIYRSWLNTLRGASRYKTANWSQMIHEYGDDILTLWENFNKDPHEKTRYLHEPKRAAWAYFIGFHYFNCLRTLESIRRVDEERHLWSVLWSQAKRLNLTDLGCGTAAISGTMLTQLPSKSPLDIRLNLVDQRRAFVKLAHEFVSQIKTPHNVMAHKIHGDVITFLKKSIHYQPQPDEYMIFCLGYLWNEMKSLKPFYKALSQLISRYASSDHPTCFYWLDTAQETYISDLMGIRDLFVNYGFQPIYPCTHHQPCPLLNTNNRCFSEYPYQPTRETKAIDRLLKLKRKNLSASCYIFVNQAFKITYPSMPVVVGRPTLSAQNFRYLLCGSHGLNATPAHKLNSRPLQRGVLFDNITTGNSTII